MSGRAPSASGSSPLRAALAIWLLLPGLLGAGGPSAAREEDSPSPIALKDAERLFLGYINDPRNLIRNCMFLGGVRIDEISVNRDVSTARIRYRIECLEEEITLPPLTRTLREIFVYRRRDDHWEILGRASELPPGARTGTWTEPSPRLSTAPDPLDRDRKAIAEKILLWAVLRDPPDGAKNPFPGGEAVAGKSQVLVSNESLGGVAEISVPGTKVLILTPGALMERTALENGGAWFRFELLEVEGDSARVRVGLVAPVLPSPRPGGESTRTLARLEAHFARSGESWVLTHSRPLE